ncbi:universal stress protein [Crossiella cryophila]|uniref:Nucleotide-binding universal stress UspA family protein n=1 Tax=Crossiella cryophila TaxID=43355 RepID=A0A7W7CGE5_9PSEU|nr:universal stress protein [Crossiella cryophila]MBB4680462.1 nucleotide-binding universal stress UspA family protein [Crossiella cryophila]
MAGTIVVGVDGSTESLRALGWSLEEADRRDADVVAVIAWVPNPVPSSATPFTVADPVDLGVDHEKLHRERLDEAILEVTGGGAHPVRTVVRQGYAGDVLTEEAAQADLLVVGSHGHGRLYSAVLGSISTECIRKATCPVVVIPPKLVPR